MRFYRVFWASAFLRLAWGAVLFLLLATVVGRLTILSGALAFCTGWPLCWPTQPVGWIAMGHRLAVALSGVMVFGLLWRAWRFYRHDAAVLPLTTVVATIYLGQVLIGAGQVLGNYPLHLMVLHRLSSFSLWVGLVVIVAVTVVRPPVAQVYRPAPLGRRLLDFLALTKPVVVALLLAITLTALIAGWGGWPPFSLFLATGVGGALAAGGASALNQVIDREVDRLMQRTQKRPIPAGRMFAAEGLAFALALCLLSYYVFAVFVNFVAAALSLAGIVYYVVVYSLLLKKTTVQNIVIGGGAGAIPPMVGWAAATGRVDGVSLLLFAIVFFWTPSHFWSLAIVRRHDYARAGVPMLPVVRGEAETRRQIWWYTLILVAITLLLPALGQAGSLYLAAALGLGAWLIWSAWRVWTGSGNKVAWQMYRWSSLYLFFLFVAFMVDRIV